MTIRLLNPDDAERNLRDNDRASDIVAGAAREFRGNRRSIFRADTHRMLGILEPLNGEEAILGLNTEGQLGDLFDVLDVPRAPENLPVLRKRLSGIIEALRASLQTPDSLSREIRSRIKIFSERFGRILLKMEQDDVPQPRESVFDELVA